MFKFLRGKEVVTDVGELEWNQVKHVWKGVVGKEWKGEHKVLVWWGGSAENITGKGNFASVGIR